MPKYNIFTIDQIQTNFTAGELSPRLYGRVDISKYYNGVSKLKNFLIQTQGGVERRTGTKFIEFAHEPAGGIVTASPPRLARFQYNVDQSYVLEFGVEDSDTTVDSGYIRFYRLDANGNPGILLQTGTTDPLIIQNLGFSGDELPNLTFTQSNDVLFIFNTNKKPQTLSRTDEDDGDAASWEYGVLEYEDGAYMDENVTDATIEPSALTGDGVTLTASDDTVFSTTDLGRHVRLSDPGEGWKFLSFGVGSVAPNPDTPANVTVEGRELYDLIAGEDGEGQTEFTGVKVEFSGITRGAVELNDTLHTAKNFTLVDSDTNTNFELHFPDTGLPEPLEGLSDEVHENGDGEVRLEPKEWTGWGIISNVDDVASDNRVAIELKSDIPSMLPTKNWRLGAWSDTTGYPKVGTFYQGRLWLASTDVQPQTLWSSESNTNTLFSPSTLEDSIVLDTSAITATLASRQVNAVTNIIGDSTGLIVLTENTEWLGRATNNKPITPSDLSFQSQSAYTTLKGVQPILAGTRYLVFQGEGAVLREFVFDLAQDRFVAKNISILSEHMSQTGAKDMELQQGRSTRVWVVLDNGSLISMIYEQEQDIVGWENHTLGQSGGTDPTVVDVSKTTRKDTDVMWFLVKRNLNGTDRYVIEALSDDFTAATLQKDAYYLDCGISDTFSPAQDTVSGLDHLEGETVYAYADSVFYGSFVVDSGSITLPVEASDVAIGLVYESSFETMPLVSQQGINQSAHKMKRVVRTIINTMRSLGGSYGTTDKLYPIEYPSATQSPPELNTIPIAVLNPSNSDMLGVMRYEQSDAHPSTIISITQEVEIGKF